MPLKGFLVVLALLVYAFHISAQESGEPAKEKLRLETAFAEQILTDAKNLRLPENRAFVYVNIGQQLWQTDEKRARMLFQNAVTDLIAAQTEAESEKGNKQYFNNLIYGQSPRWEILNAIAVQDADYALDQMLRTRPAKLAQALANFTGDNQLPSQQFARSELQNEQRIIAQAAEQNPQRAVKLLRESLKKDVTYYTFNLLKKIHQKDAESADQLADEVGRKLLGAKLDASNQDTSLIENFLIEFGREQPKENPSISVSDELIRSLGDKIIKFMLRPNSNSYNGNSSALQIVEKFFPAEVAKIKEKHAKFQSQNQSEQNNDYYKLIQNDVSSEELLSQAGKFPVSQRREIYRRAADKIAQSGNVAQAQSILTENLPEENVEQYLSQFNFNLANQATARGDFDQAAAYIDGITDENHRQNALVNLAAAVYQKDPKENQSRATAILDQARALLPESPVKASEMNSLVNLAAGYAKIAPAQAFSLVESLTPQLNELSEASAVVAKYQDGGNFRQGEYQINQGSNQFQVYYLVNVLQTLKSTDFERTARFTNGFSRLDLRISLQIQLLQLSLNNLPINGGRFRKRSFGTFIN